MGNTVDENGYVVDDSGDRVTTSDGEPVRANSGGDVFIEHSVGVLGESHNSKSNDSKFDHETGKFYKK